MAPAMPNAIVTTIPPDLFRHEELGQNAGQESNEDRPEPQHKHLRQWNEIRPENEELEPICSAVFKFAFARTFSAAKTMAIQNCAAEGVRLSQTSPRRL
jgi:hypothetical protein